MDLTRQFHQLYDAPPTLQVEAPGRINLIGEHVDYLGGKVLPAAIDAKLTILAAPAPNSRIAEIWSPLCREAPAVIRLNDLSPRTDPSEGWLNYIIGVLAGYDPGGESIPGFRAAISSTLPTGAGLSSSAALETATALVAEALTGTEKSVLERALLCQRAEHDFAGLPCGIMDQLSVGGGIENHALLIDCSELTWKPVPLPGHLSIVVTDSGVSHDLATTEYRKRRQDCESALEVLGKPSWRAVGAEFVEENRSLLGDRFFRRARHAVTEMARVEAFADALESGDEDSLGLLMLSSHDSLRNDYEVSCTELDELVESAYEFGGEAGHVGSRMTGGGFGGSTVSLVRANRVEKFIEHLQRRFRERFEKNPNCFVSRASRGARMIEL